MMRNLFVLFLVFGVLYGGGCLELLSEHGMIFSMFARQYYKAWAVGYCLGYYEMDKTREHNPAINDEDRRIEKSIINARKKKAFIFHPMILCWM